MYVFRIVPSTHQVLFFLFFFKREKGVAGKKHRFVVPVVYAFIG